jgi:hypothetical protein
MVARASAFRAEGPGGSDNGSAVSVEAAEGTLLRASLSQIKFLV